MNKANLKSEIACDDAKPPPPSAKAKLLDSLFVAGQTLVFCDDSDVAGQPITKLEPDLRILVAVQIRSDTYAELHAAISKALADYGVSEFHATDIATGNREWKGRSSEERAGALTFLAHQLGLHAGRIGGLWLPKGQYPVLRTQAEKQGKVSAGFKMGLKRAFVRSVVERLANGHAPAMLWLDQDTPLAAPKAESWPGAEFLVGGGPIVAPSHSVAGLQLADLAVWSVQRYMTKREGYEDGSATEFDDVALEVVASFPTGLDDLRGDALIEDWAP